MCSIIVHWSDVDRTMLSIVVWFTGLAIFTKLVAIVTAEKKVLVYVVECSAQIFERMNLQMKVLYRSVANNWITVTDEEERKILVEYLKLGRKKAMYYFGTYTTNFLLGIPRRSLKLILLLFVYSIFLKHSCSLGFSQ